MNDNSHNQMCSNRLGDRRTHIARESRLEQALTPSQIFLPLDNTAAATHAHLQNHWYVVEQKPI